jgi:hypothetical protein
MRDYFSGTQSVSTFGPHEINPVSELVKDDVEKLNLFRAVG